MKTRGSVPAQNKKQQVLPKPQQQHVRKISKSKIIDYEIDYPPIPSNHHKKPKTSVKKKFYVVGDSHIKRVNKHIINHISHESTNLTLRNYDGDNTKVIKHNLLPILHDKHPDGMIIHCRTNDITEKNLHSLRPDELATQIIEVGKLCQLFGVKNVAISSILLKSDESLNVKIQEVNSYLRDKCEFYNIDFISNENISVKYLHSDGVHLNDVGSYLLEKNFGKYIFSWYY